MLKTPKESFTDGDLISLALQGDREAIAEVCELIAERMNPELFSERFVGGMLRIGQGESPNSAFDWQLRTLRKELKDEARAINKKLTSGDIWNDDGLCDYVRTVLKALVPGRPPDDAFKWKQPRAGRRVAKLNTFRNWDIQMSVCTLMKERFDFFRACEIVSEAATYPIGHKAVLAIAKGTTANSDPELPSQLFPMPKNAAIRQDRLDVTKEIYKSLKIKK